MTTCKCPVCDSVLSITAKKEETKKRHRWPWRWLNWDDTTTFETSAPQFKTQPTAGAIPWQKQPTPQQQPSGNLGPGETIWRKLDIDDVRIPLLIGLAGFAPVVIAGTLIYGSVQLWKPLLWVTCPVGIILIGADLVFWLMVWPHIRHDENKLIMRKRDAEKATPQPERAKADDRQVNITVSDGKGHDKRASFLDDAKFHNLANALINGAPATEATAKKYGISRARWEKIRDILIDRGWARWRDQDNTKAGVEMMRAGLAALDASLPCSDGTSD